MALNNTLDGGLGLDQMTGGAGNDLYRVDNEGELAIESIAGAKGGYDYRRKPGLRHAHRQCGAS